MGGAGGAEEHVTDMPTPQKHEIGWKNLLACSMLSFLPTSHSQQGLCWQGQGKARKEKGRERDSTTQAKRHADTLWKSERTQGLAKRIYNKLDVASASLCIQLTRVGRIVLAELRMNVEKIEAKGFEIVYALRRAMCLRMGEEYLVTIKIEDYIRCMRMWRLASDPPDFSDFTLDTLMLSDYPPSREDPNLPQDRYTPEQAEAQILTIIRDGWYNDSMLALLPQDESSLDTIEKLATQWLLSQRQGADSLQLLGAPIQGAVEDVNVCARAFVCLINPEPGYLDSSKADVDKLIPTTAAGKSAQPSHYKDFSVELRKGVWEQLRTIHLKYLSGTVAYGPAVRQAIATLEVYFQKTLPDEGSTELKALMEVLKDAMDRYSLWLREIRPKGLARRFDKYATYVCDQRLRSLTDKANEPVDEGSRSNAKLTVERCLLYLKSIQAGKESQGEKDVKLIAESLHKVARDCIVRWSSMDTSGILQKLLMDHDNLQKDCSELLEKLRKAGIGNCKSHQIQVLMLETLQVVVKAIDAHCCNADNTHDDLKDHLHTALALSKEQYPSVEPKVDSATLQKALEQYCTTVMTGLKMRQAASKFKKKPTIDGIPDLLKMMALWNEHKSNSDAVALKAHNVHTEYLSIEQTFDTSCNQTLISAKKEAHAALTQKDKQLEKLVKDSQGCHGGGKDGQHWAVEVTDDMDVTETLKVGNDILSQALGHKIKDLKTKLKED